MRNSLKTLLFVSAFSPTLLVLAGVRFHSLGMIDTLTIQLAAVSILGSSLPLLIVWLAKKEGERHSFTAKKVEPADYFLLVFLGSYSLPVVMKAAEISPLLMVLLTAMIFFVAWIISLCPSHPVLYMFKFRFYKVESSDGMVYWLITRKAIRTPKDIGQVIKLSDAMLWSDACR